MKTSLAPLVQQAAQEVRRAVLDQPPTLGDGDCEALHSGFFLQPVNTVTSLSFIAVGIWGASRITSLARSDRLPAAAYATIVALNGVGSVAYHGPQFPGAQTMHDLPAYGIVGLGLGVPIWRRLRGRAALPGWSSTRAAAMAVGVVVAGSSYVGGRTASRTCNPASWVQFHGLWHLSTAGLMAVTAAVLWPVPDEPAATASDEPRA